MNKEERDAIKIEFGLTDEFLELLIDLDRRWARYGEQNFLKRTLNDDGGNISAGMGLLIVDKNAGL